MKRENKVTVQALIILIVLTVVSHASQAQTYLNNPYPRTISVEGSAEMEVVPDEVFVNFKIEEYNKKGEGKQDIEVLKKQFLSVCRSVGISDTDININRFGGEVSDFPRKRRNPDMMASITYQIRFQTAKKLDQLIALVDDEATSSFSVVAAQHTRASEFRKDLKIKALKAAKEKGSYLAASVGEEIGIAITIEEPDENRYGSNISNMVSQSTNTRYEQPTIVYGDDGIAFRKIKYRYVMKAIFELKVPGPFSDVK